MGLNPEWRVRDGVLVREGEGSWDQMRQPGANGFLGVLIALRWWMDEEVEMDDWRVMVDDVTWVIEALIGEGKTQAKRGRDAAGMEGTEMGGEGVV